MDGPGKYAKFNPRRSEEGETKAAVSGLLFTSEGSNRTSENRVSTRAKCENSSGRTDTRSSWARERTQHQKKEPSSVPSAGRPAGTSSSTSGGGVQDGDEGSGSRVMYQNFFRLFPKVNLEKLVKPLYKNKKKESAPWKYARRRGTTRPNEAETTTTTSNETFYTARESLSGSIGRGVRMGGAGDKVQPEDLERPTLRTPLMMLLLLANEILIFCSLIFMSRWLVNYRGGVQLVEAFWPGGQREPKHSVNLHAASMSFCFAFCMPQVAVAKIFFERFSQKTRTNIELTVRSVGFVAFVVGMQQIYSVDQRHLPDHLDGPDKGIHLILSGAAIGVYLVSTLNFMLNAIIFYYGEVKDTIVLGYLINLFLNSHVVETLGHLLDLVAFLSLLTGYLAYIILLFTASYYDLRHIFNDPISAGSAETVKEEDAYLVVIIVLTFMYLTSVCIIFYQHNLLYHNGIITYQMYKNNFKEIADALARAKNQKEAIQEMTDIEALAQYENPQAARVSQGREPTKDGMVFKKRSPFIRDSTKTEEEAKI